MVAKTARVVRIVADDLTGALDAASPFAAADRSLPVLWRRERAAGLDGSLALDLESRDGPFDHARRDILPGVFAGASVAFAKVDSLLRGEPAREIAACLDAGRFERALIAPAFPAQQRITRGGRQLWRTGPHQRWRTVARDLAAEMRALGHHVELAASAEVVRGNGVFLCDAASDENLEAIVAAGSRLAPPILWAGTAGLAHALAGPATTPAAAPKPPALILVGSRHPVTTGQVEALTRHRDDAVVRLRSEAMIERDRALDHLARHLGAGGTIALVFDLPEGTAPEAAGAVISACFEAMVGRLSPRSLVVTGGATLVRLMRAIGADALLVRGELLPGVPCSRIRGGPWDGTTVVSKSGAFGRADILVYLADLCEAAGHD